MRIRYLTMKELREDYEHGVEALVGRSVSDNELVDFLNDESDLDVRWDSVLQRYLVSKSTEEK